MKEHSELTRLLPKNREDVDGVRALLAHGYPTLEPVLGSLFQWLDTSGSPVELEIRPFFASLGEPALELAREALCANIKPARKHALLRYVLPNWSRETLLKLESELLPLVQEYSYYGLDVWALSLMLQKGVGPQTELEGWRKLKISGLTDQLKALSL
jgi:hypothetical protein